MGGAREMPFYHYSAFPVIGGTEDMLYLAHGGTVEGALQAGFVNISAAYFTELLGVELTFAPGFYGEMHERCLSLSRPVS